MSAVDGEALLTVAPNGLSGRRARIGHERHVRWVLDLGILRQSRHSLHLL